MSRSLSPKDAWEALSRGEAELLDLRSSAERRRFGAPPGSRAVSLARHALRPEGRAAIYLCQHATRSKLALHRGAAEVAGGFAAWKDAGLPIEEVST